MSDNFKPGTYRAKILNYCLTESKAGIPQIEVQFAYSENGVTNDIRWWGSFSEKAAQYTIKNLVTLGFKGKTNEDFSKLAEGVKSGMLDTVQEVNLVLDNEIGQNGKTYLRVKYLNSLSSMKPGLSAGDAKVKLGSMNLAGQLALVKQELGLNYAQAPQSAGTPEDDFSF